MRNEADKQQAASTLHIVDAECVKVIGCLRKAMAACYEHDLKLEMMAVYDAVCVLHKNATAKFNQTNLET